MEEDGSGGFPEEQEPAGWAGRSSSLGRRAGGLQGCGRRKGGDARGSPKTVVGRSPAPAPPQGPTSGAQHCQVPAVLFVSSMTLSSPDLVHLTSLAFLPFPQPKQVGSVNTILL